MYLLDTHILLWWLTDDEKLSKKHREIIANPKNIIFLSATSVWEISIKEGLGKISIPKNFYDILDKQGFEDLSITKTHAREISKLKNIHADPFDRLLVAQAKTENLMLLTVDKNIKKYPVKIL